MGLRMGWGHTHTHAPLRLRTSEAGCPSAAIDLHGGWAISGAALCACVGTLEAALGEGAPRAARGALCARGGGGVGVGGAAALPWGSVGGGAAAGPPPLAARLA